MSQYSTDVPASQAAGLRHEPVQARSTARLGRLLDAAATIVDTVGFERLTTAMVAEHAGASIGTVYRYFPDRIAVLQALAARNRDSFLQRIDRALTEQLPVSPLAGMGVVTDELVDAYRTVPGFGSIRFGDTIDLRPRQERGSARVAAGLAEMLGRRFELPADAEYHLDTALCMLDALLARAFDVDASGDARSIEEAREIVDAHLSDRLA